jgi:hypothetical protein
MGPQIAPNVGQLITTFMIDLSNAMVAAQNTMVQPTGMTKLSSLPVTQCK